jgi:anthranilate/para-aminobenzoate synthase component I
MTKIQDSKRERFTKPAKSNRTVALRTVAAADKGILCRLHCRQIRKSINLPVLSETFATLKNPTILGGNIARKDADRFSYWAAYPKEVFEFLAGQNEPFAKLQTALDKYKLEEDQETALPKGIFRGGWVGYFSYELGRYIEKLPETTHTTISKKLSGLSPYRRRMIHKNRRKN